MTRLSPFCRHLLMIALMSWISACTFPFKWLGIQFLYTPTNLPAEQVTKDVPYVEGSPSQFHRLNLFLPRKKNWPVLVFIPGGGWRTADKDLSVGGADVYGNIGRFFAARGIGVVIINYRLLPEVTWNEQIRDCARAVAWVHRNISSHGGDPENLFLSGHSAGAQLATRLALDPQALSGQGSSKNIVKGVIAVSGAGYDMADEKTYALGADPKYYSGRFQTDPNSEDWKIQASPLRFAAANAPPFLVIYAAGESKALHRQSQLLHERLSSFGVPTQLVVVPGESHERIVLTLSRDDKTAGPAILKFVHAAGD